VAIDLYRLTPAHRQAAKAELDRHEAAWSARQFEVVDTERLAEAAGQETKWQQRYAECEQAIQRLRDREETLNRWICSMREAIRDPAPSHAGQGAVAECEQEIQRLRDREETLNRSIRSMREAIRDPAPSHAGQGAVAECEQEIQRLCDREEKLNRSIRSMREAIRDPAPSHAGQGAVAECEQEIQRLRNRERKLNRSIRSMREAIVDCERSLSPAMYITMSIAGGSLSVLDAFCCGVATEPSLGVVAGFVLFCISVPAPVVWFYLRSVKLRERLALLHLDLALGRVW